MSTPVSSEEHAARALRLDPTNPDPDHRRCLDDWLQFHAALAFEPERACALLEGHGNPRRALERARIRLPLDATRLARVRQALVRAEVVALPLTSIEYPAPLRALRDAAPLLFVAGDVSLLSGRLVAIVGARAATVYGRSLARALARRLGEAGVTVVSGLARGVDAAAHRGALEASAATVAVQACGPEQVYPAEHRRLAREIRTRGAMLSELPVGTPPRPPYFPMRNRLISGLSRCVVVVEARERSGSLITARHALDQGREVLAIPGPVTSPTSQGPNRLIRDGATPVLEVDDVLDALGLRNDDDVEQTEADCEGADEALGDAGREILAVLAHEALTRDELGRRVEGPPEQLDLELVDLQLLGRVQHDRDGRLVKVPKWKSRRRGEAD